MFLFSALFSHCLCYDMLLVVVVIVVGGSFFFLFVFYITNALKRSHFASMNNFFRSYISYFLWRFIRVYLFEQMYFFLFRGCLNTIAHISSTFQFRHHAQWFRMRFFRFVLIPKLEWELTFFRYVFFLFANFFSFT